MIKKILALFILFFSLNTFSTAENVYTKPVVVTFYRNNCEECEQMNELRKNFIEQYKDKAYFVRINMDVEDCDYEKLARKYNITSAPVTLFLNAQYGITKKTAGVIPEKLYKKQIEAILVE